MSQLYLHIGYAKTGSSSIQRHLQRNWRKLNRLGYDILTGELESCAALGWNGHPGRHLEALRTSGADPGPFVRTRIVEAAAQGRLERLILSAENLSNPPMHEWFAGLDDVFATTLILYVRPQAEWLPSAWKQWGLKNGTSFSDFLAERMAQRKPNYLATANAWRAALPKARLEVRLLHDAHLHRRDLLRDFCHSIDLADDLSSLPPRRLNATFDYSLLAVMAKNPQLFEGPHDNRLYGALNKLLDPKYRQANIAFLSEAQRRAVERCYRDQNRELLSRYCGIADADLDQVYDQVFDAPSSGRSLAEVGDVEILYRCLGILIETLAGQAAKPEPPAKT